MPRSLAIKILAACILASGAFSQSLQPSKDPALADSLGGNILQILAEMSWDTLLLLVGLAFVAVAVLGNISGKINPGKQGRIAAGVVGTCLVVGGIWYHGVLHGFRVTGSTVAANPVDQSGPCPLIVKLQGIVDATGEGNADYDFEFSTGNASDLNSVSFSKTGSQIVAGEWHVLTSLQKAYYLLRVHAPDEKISKRSGFFSVTCIASPAMSSHTEAPTSTAVDSVVFDSVDPKPGTYLKTGQPTTFTIGVTYNLASAASAILSISTAQLPASSKSCSGAAGELVDAVQVPVIRGKHQTVVRLTWSGDTGVATKGRIYGAGFVGFTPMFWASNNGARGERLDYFGTYQGYCYAFGK